MPKDQKETARDRHITRAIHRLFFRAMLESKGLMVLALLCHVPAFLSQNVLMPLATAYALQAIITRHFNQVGKYVLLTLGFSLLYNVFLSVGSLVYGRNGVIGGAYVQREVFHNFLHKDYDFYGNSFFGSLGEQAARLRDTFITYNELVLFIVPKQITIVVAAIAVIAYKSWLLAGVTVACMILALAYTLLSSRFRIKYRRIVGQASSDVAALVGDALSHAATVKSFATEEREEHRLLAPLQRWYAAQLKSWDLFIPANAGRTLLVTGTTCVLLLVTSHLYQQHIITIAMVAVVQLYAIKLLNVTEEISQAVKTYEATMGASYLPVRTMLVQPTVLDAAKPKRLPAKRALDISLRDVTYGYTDAGGQTAVEHFSLDVAHGEKIGFVGYSGSGKTTLTKLLLRFMDIQSGSITLAGTDIRDIAQKDLRQRIAYVPQEPLLFHRSIAENIAYANPRATKADIRRAAKLAYVDEFVHQWPQGFDTLVGERGVKLSGGQRQRVAIARALLKDAPILVLDEATSALDSRSERLIQEALWNLMKNRTALVIAHRLSTIQRMDKIVVMEQGRIVQFGTHDELLGDKHGVYAQLWAHQSGGYLAGPETG